MSIEVEVKVPVNNLDEIRNKLVKLGARYLETRLETDIYLNHPSRDFSKTGEALRIRVSNGSCLLTYKSALDGTMKVRRELEVQCSNASVLLEILEALGFHPMIKISKIREVYELKDNIRLYLDEVRFLGRFLEIEVTCPSNRREEAEAIIKNLISSLKLSGPLITIPYIELIFRKRNTQGKC